MTDAVSLNRLAVAINAVNEEKGFNEGARPNDPTWLGSQLALIHSEVSEALEDVRDGRMTTTREPSTGKPVGFPSELADVLIRVLHLCEQCDIDIEDEVAMKFAYNKTRARRHGGKTL